MASLEERFMTETGETDSDIVSSFLSGAEQTILFKTNRKEMIDQLSESKLQLAICRYGKRGNEGLKSYSEGGENESYLSEDEILSGVTSYRLAFAARRMKDEKEES